MTTYMITRRNMMKAAGALGFGGLPLISHAEPSVAMATIVVGLAAGGATDAAARRLAEGLRGTYAKSTVVENKTGAGARLAIQHVKSSVANGTTMLLTPASMMAIYPHTYKNLAYDPQKDFVPIGIVSTSDLGFAVGPAVPSSVKSINDYLEWTKASPARSNFGSGATGSGPHFLGELLGRLGKVSMAHAGYRGSQPAILEMMGGHLPAVSAPLGEFLPHLKTGLVRVLAVTGSKRSNFMPDVPTFQEIGIPLSDMTEWFGVFMPAGTPNALVQQASAAMKIAVANPELINAYGMMGMEAIWSTPQELANRLSADLQRWKKVVEQIGFTAKS